MVTYGGLEDSFILDHKILDIDQTENYIELDISFTGGIAFD